MSPLLDLLCVVMSWLLMALGVWIVYLALRGDRWRRRRTAALRCPGRWARLLILPWRMSCWYDLSVARPGRDGRRLCPECGRRSKPSQLRRSRRSVLRFALGMLVIGVGAALGFGRELVHGGVRAAPTWALALAPFDVDRWVNLPPPAKGTLLDQIAEELHLRDQAGQVGGLEGELLAWRVDNHIRRAGDHRHQAEPPDRARAIAAASIGDGFDETTLGSVAEALSASTGLTIRIADEPHTGPSWQRQLGPFLLRELRVSLPAWPMRLDQGLDLACARAAPDVRWRATHDGCVIECLPAVQARGLIDARVLGAGSLVDDPGAARRINPASGVFRATAAMWVQNLVGARRLAGGAGGAGIPQLPIYYGPDRLTSQQARERVGPAAWRRLFSRACAAGIANVDGYNLFYGTGTNGVGNYVLFELSLAEFRRRERLWAALRAGPSAPGPNRATYLATLARLDEPIQFPQGAVRDLASLLDALASATALRIVCDPVLSADAAYDRVLLSRGPELRTWRAGTTSRLVAGIDAALLTDPATAALLREPRVYRLRGIGDLPTSDLRDPGPVEAHELMAMLCRAVGVDPPVWGVPGGPGLADFVVNTRPDEHAELSWLVEQVEGVLRTGATSPLSAAAGSPMGVYNLSTIVAAADKPSMRWEFRRPIAEVGALVAAIHELTDARGLRGAALSYRAGPVLVVRASIDVHARVRAALEAMNARLGEVSVAPPTPPVEAAEPANRASSGLGP